MNSGGVGIAPSSPPPPFLCKTYNMVDDPATDQVVSWSKTNNSFVVWNVPDISRDLLPLYFKHNNFSSFVRQLNAYGFRKVDPDRWEFSNDGFLRGHKHLLNTIYRRKQLSVAVHNSSAKSCVEVGKFGIEEEVGRLKRDKNVLMHEIFRLRQHQQSTDRHLENVGQRVHVMEQRLQQMMSFLANARQSSDSAAQLVHHQSESNRQISSGSKKRRLPEQDKEIKQSVVQIDGQMIKYQPIVNEAAKVMLRKILKMNTSESKLINPNSFLIDNVHTSSDVLDSGSLSCRKSGVTLAGVLPTMSALTDIQSSSALTLGKAHDTIFSAGNIGLPAFAGNNFDLTNELVNGARAQDMVWVDAIPGFVQNPIPFMSNEFSADEDGDVLPDDVDKLPSINDVFWEQFLFNSPLTGDINIVNTGGLGDVIGNNQLMVQEGEWDKLKHLNNLTEQMGLLASASNVG